LANGDLERAASEIQKALDAGAGRAQGLSLLGDVYLRRGAYGEALDRYRQARQVDATSKAALAGEVRASCPNAVRRPSTLPALALVAPHDVDSLLLTARARRRGRS
jgi:tetratricopeptide (TPR) repeat protein